MRIASLLLGVATLCGMIVPHPGAFVPAATQESAPEASRALADLIKKSDEAYLRRNPAVAISRGDSRYADRYGSFISAEYYAAEKVAAEVDLAALSRIDRNLLTAAERVSYDAFKWQREMDRNALQDDILSLTLAIPVHHIGNFVSDFPMLNSGAGLAQFKSVEDYENGLRRIDGYVSMLDEAVAQMRAGMAAGRTQPRSVMAKVLVQLDDMIAANAETSLFTAAMTRFPQALPVSERLRLQEAYSQAFTNKVLPALQRMKTFIQEEYLPNARETIGLGDLAGGDRLYRHLINYHTTTDLTPDEIYETGLRMVAKTQAEMEQVKQAIGFDGNLKEFFEYMKNHPDLKPKSADALLQGYLALAKQIDQKVGNFFRKTPKARLEIRPTPAMVEKTATRASYDVGTPDGVRPGVFQFNTYDLPSRSIVSMTAVYLHEGVPGHHYQMSLAQENLDLPDFQRFSLNLAFLEGWAFYAEDFGSELGLYKDPYQYFGYLESKLLRSVRLVVDTGIHAKGWSREKAINYMSENSPRSGQLAEAEIDRYTALPGQALSYMIGFLKMKELRARSEAALGARFDIKEYHEEILKDGGIPLMMLERKIDSWIASKKAQ